MKTFEEYIKEAVDFRLGGKANKGVAAPKTFEELERGNYLYYWNFADSGSKLTLRLGFECRITSIDKNSFNITIKYAAEEGNEKYLDSDTLYVHNKKRNNSMVLLSDFDDVNAVEIMTTYEDTPEHILATAEEMWNEIIANESVDFRLGGKKQSGYDQEEHKAFKELKTNDNLFKSFVKSRGMRALEVSEKRKLKVESVEFDYSIKITCDVGFCLIPSRDSDKSEYVYLNIDKGEHHQIVYSTYELNDSELIRVVNNAMKKVS